MAAVEAAEAAAKRMKRIEESRSQMAEENAVEINRINAEAADRLAEMER